MSLNTSLFNGSPLFHLQEGNKRHIIKESPKLIKCLVMHQRFMMDPHTVSLISDGNICVECIIIRSDYQNLPKEQKILFEPSTIIRYVLPPSSLVVCLLLIVLLIHEKMNILCYILYKNN